MSVADGMSGECYSSRSQGVYYEVLFKSIAGSIILWSVIQVGRGEYNIMECVIRVGRGEYNIMECVIRVGRGEYNIMECVIPVSYTHLRAHETA